MFGGNSCEWHISFRMQAIGRTTDWHETQQKYYVWKNNKANEKKIEQELNEANDKLKILRNQRLKELYEKEMQQYQDELAEMGLAIAYVGNDE